MSNTNNSTMQPDDAKAVATLQKYIRPKGLIRIGAIDPAVKNFNPVCETFDLSQPEEATKARKFIRDEQAKKRNVYYETGIPKRRMTKKSAKTDIAFVQDHQADLDPVGSETAKAAKVRIRKLIEDSGLPQPTFLFSTGSGMLAVWRRKKALKLDSPEAIAKAEAVNAALRDKLGGKQEAGADHCISVDHFFRVPYTVNHPDALKIAKGRKVCMSGDFEANGTRYDESELPAVHVKPPTKESKAIGDADDVDIAKLKLSPRSLSIFKTGEAEGDRPDDDSTSGWRMALINSLKREGKSDETTLGVLMHPDCFVATEKRSTDAGCEKLYRSEIAKATAFREANGLESNVAAEDDFDDIPDEDEDADNVNDGAFAISPYEPKDPTQIPRREWLYGSVYIRKFIGLTAATGGAGKSSLILVECVAMACGKNLLGVDPVKALRVLYWNGEDPQPELDRRVEAILKWFKLTKADLGGRLFVVSGRDTKIKIAEVIHGTVKIVKPMTRAMVRTIRKHKLDVVGIDPFVSSHAVPENDNNAIELVAKKWADIADKTNCAVILSHHTRKTNGGNASIEDSRGASALNYAARTRRAINTMTAVEAKACGITDERARLSYFKADMMGSSMMKPTAALNWYRFESVDLMNGPPDDDGKPTPGDSVGVVVAWEYKALATVLSESLAGDVLDALKTAKGPWPASPQSPEWIGFVIAEAAGLDPKAPDDRKVIRGQMAEWLDSNVLFKITGKNAHGRDTPMIGLDAFPDDLDFG